MKAGLAVDRLTCRGSKYRIQLLFSPVRVLCCLTGPLRASYDLRAIWKHSNHRLPNRVSHRLHLVKGLVVQGLGCFSLASRNSCGKMLVSKWRGHPIDRRGRAKRQQAISLESIRMYTYFKIPSNTSRLHCDYLPALARLAARTGLKSAGKKAHLWCSTPLRHGLSILKNYRHISHGQDLIRFVV